MSTKPIMKCGHQVVGRMTSKGVEIIACGTCFGKPEAEIIDVEATAALSTTSRRARCESHGKRSGPQSGYGRNESNHGCDRKPICDCEEPSSKAADERLAFFRSIPTEPFDRFYCGCHGWD